MRFSVAAGHYQGVPAFLITFTCYGSHLPGQEGCIDRRHNVPGSRRPEPNEALREFWSVADPFELGAAERPIVLSAIREVCRFRGWSLLAAHIRASHVHVVVSANCEPEHIMNSFKAYASRALNKTGETRRRWTRHGSTKYLNSPETISAAVRYVLEGQGAPMELYACDLASRHA